MILKSQQNRIELVTKPDVPQPDNAEFDINGSVEVQSICVLDFIRKSTGEFCRLGRCSLDWATAQVGEADRELTCVTLTHHSSGPIYETLAQSTKSLGSML